MSKHFLRFFSLLALVALTFGGFTPPPVQAQAEQPKLVVIPGTIQSKLGCPGDWQPDCDKTALAYDPANDLWMATFELPAGDYEYKVAINGSWDENYGAKAERNGPNIKLSLTEARKVTFWYSRATNWVADNVNSILANVPGSYQKEIGCPDDWMPSCFRTLLQDPDGDGIYTFITKDIPAGSFEAKVALNGSWSLNYGARGARDGANIAFESIGKEILFEWDSNSKVMNIKVEGAPKGNLTLQRAHWGTRDTFVWPAKVPDARSAKFFFHYSPDASLQLTPEGVKGGEVFPLKYEFGVTSAITLKFPHLQLNYSLSLPADVAARAPEFLKGQIALSATNDKGELLDATGVQIPGVLDDLYDYGGSLGLVVTDAGLPNFALWAPTARNVTLHIFPDAKPETPSTTFPMEYDAENGLWFLTGKGEWLNQYYLYEVEVFVPTTGKIEKNLVTDPYSYSLSMNSTRSHIVDLYDPALAPQGWADLKKPALAAPEDIVVYELHIRDFSIKDQSVPAELRGTYGAFTVPDSAGMKHLKALADAGLTHVHLLPMFDIATIDEDRAKQQGPDPALLATFPPDSDKQQAEVNKFRQTDGFNWGYDPFHYGVPEGSYAVNPEGAARILELRKAVQGLNNVGLRVVMDVVFNHTNASGQAAKSVLDKVVPGYYHRLNEDGKVERSTCCENTATEHKMMEKLMIDMLIHWAVTYKIDAFRFDLMGHHMKANMQAVRAALDSLTPEVHGVNGKEIYLYGEGWNFGEVADNKRGVNATQINLAGTGIGTFNDRIRDAVRGGNPFGGRQDQGFSNGLFDDPNEADKQTPDERKAKLLLFADQIKVALAGNLKDYVVIDAKGNSQTGERIRYNGQPSGYTLDPQEHIAYVSKHDNETIFDLIQYKAPLGTSMADRVRMNTLALSFAMFSQGVPFFHAGDDILRSKSQDRDSYDSGDWFNAIDWTLETNNWGIGLPIEDKNKDMWPIIGPLLANPALKPTKADLQAANAAFRELLRIRRSSKLFRLETGEQVKTKVKFVNTGPDQIPGVIVMQLDDTVGPDVDPAHQMVVVVFNTTKSAVTVTDKAFAGMTFTLHPVQMDSADAVVRTATFADGAFSVPARTVAVFVVKQ
jgi:pullulanase-type alpha-1,6-glucosidase